jgi:hypothetical protein
MTNRKAPAKTPIAARTAASASRAARTTASAPADRRADSAFERIALVMHRDESVDDTSSSRGRGFGSRALKTGGKIFAMRSQGTVVIKLPRARVGALIASGAGSPYDPGHGRVAREWVGLQGDEENWLPLAREACAFVARSSQGPQGRRT